MATSTKTSSKSKTKVKTPTTTAMSKVDTDNVPESTAVAPSVVETLSPVVMRNELRKKELFELVVERSGMKKKDVKPVVEALLAVLGDALSEQREMYLPPLGKLKVQRGKELPDGRALVLKLRQKTSHLKPAPKPEETE